MKIRELMTRNVEACSPETTIASAVDTLWRRDCGAIPVVDRHSKLVGIATDRDFCVALGTRNRLASELTVGEVMSRQCVTCGPEEEARTALEKMRRSKVRRLPVVDGNGKLLGIVSLADLARCAAPSSMNGLTDDDVISAFKSVCEQRPYLQPELARR